MKWVSAKSFFAGGRNFLLVVYSLRWYLGAAPSGNLSFSFVLPKSKGAIRVVRFWLSLSTLLLGNVSSFSTDIMKMYRSSLSYIIDQCHPEADWSDYECLMMLIKKGDKNGVMNLLSKGCRVVRPGTFNTPLHLAVERVGWAYIVKQLLDRGALVAFVNAKNDTALHHAFLCEATDMAINSMIVSYLKASKENIVNNDGVSYLHIMCARSKLTYVKDLIVNGININVNSQVRMTSKSAYAGFTALHFAVEYGKIDIAKYLLENKASVYIKDANGSTPLHLACYRQNVEIIDLLLCHCRPYINVTDNLGTSHFIAACMSSETTFVKQYLIVACRRYKLSPLTLICKKLCESIAYPFPGYTPLHFAAKFGRLETVKILLSCGAFCCAVAMTGETPFTLAEKNSHVEICDVLKRHCQEYQTLMIANQSPMIQSQGTAGFSISNTSDTSCDSSINQNYSLPDMTSNTSAPACALNKYETPVDISTSNCQYYSNN